MKATLTEIDIAGIAVKRLIRKDSGDLTTLQNSIRKHGLVYPLIVDRNNVLIVGSRRLQACRAVGLARVPVIRLDVEYDSMVALEIRADVSLCRQPLTAAELAHLIEMKKDSLALETKPFWSVAGMTGRIKRFFTRSFARS